MFITYDPNLAAVLSGQGAMAPTKSETLLFGVLLTAQLLSLVAIGLLVP